MTVRTLIATTDVAQAKADASRLLSDDIAVALTQEVMHTLVNDPGIVCSKQLIDAEFERKHGETFDRYVERLVDTGEFSLLKADDHEKIAREVRRDNEKKREGGKASIEKIEDAADQKDSDGGMGGGPRMTLEAFNEESGSSDDK